MGKLEQTNFHYRKRTTTTTCGKKKKEGNTTMVMMLKINAVRMRTVSYTHLTLPTRSTV